MTCIKGLILRANTHAKKARALLGDIIREIMHAPPENFFPRSAKNAFAIQHLLHHSIV